MSAFRLVIRRLAAALVLLTVGFISGWVSATIFADSISLTRLVPAIGPGLVANQETPPSLRQQFRVFWEVWNLVEAEFYRRDKINHTRMIRGAISGMLGSLDDPYTVYQNRNWLHRRMSTCRDAWGASEPTCGSPTDAPTSTSRSKARLPTQPVFDRR